MGMTKTTPIPALNIESNTPPIKNFVNKHKMKYVARIMHRGNNLAEKINTGKSSSEMMRIYVGEQNTVSKITQPGRINCGIENLSVETELLQHVSKTNMSVIVYQY